MIHQLRAKLRSQSGVSMMIAILFLAFCIFIGGSVLAAASANATRIKSLANQQDYLTSRSTAILLGDQMQLEDTEILRLKVLDVDRTVYDYKAVNGGYACLRDGTGKPRSVRERTITFTIDTNVIPMNPLQRLQMESAIQRYLKENPTESGVSYTKIQIVGKTATLLADGDIDRIDSDTVLVIPNGPGGSVHANQLLWLDVSTDADDDTVQAVLDVKEKDAPEGSNVEVPDFYLMVTSGTGDECYDISLEAGAPSPVRLRLRSYENTVRVRGDTPQDVQDEIDRLGEPPLRDMQPRNGKYQDRDFQGDVINVVSHVQYNVAIGWENPTVEKGGG